MEGGNAVTLITEQLSPYLSEDLLHSLAPRVKDALFSFHWLLGQYESQWASVQCLFILRAVNQSLAAAAGV